MTDEESKELVERLRDCSIFGAEGADSLCAEAADRIEELRIGLRNAQGDVVNARKRIIELEAQLAAERGALSSHVRKALGVKE